MSKKSIIIQIFALVLIVSACNHVGGNSFVPAPIEYSDSYHSTVLLKRPLREISGIDFISDKELIAINDEAGKIFFLNPLNGEFTVFEFGSKGDYEDIVKVENSYYVLNSNGFLYEVDITNKTQRAVFAGSYGKHMEFESLCYDKKQHQLLLICKECGKNQNSISAYSFDLNTKTFSANPYFSISWEDIRKMAKDNSIECRPSAAAINPVNNKLYIIASLGKVLLEATIGGKLEGVYNLNPDHFPQPEGITFGTNGDMYIANEGVEGKASLLKFNYAIPK
jgi:uncharacterized protein YjiK